MGKRYGKLPSEVLAQADTFDLMVFDVSVTYQNYQNQKQNNTGSPTEYYDQDQLQSLMQKVRKQ
jgi:hypothetical protein